MRPALAFVVVVILLAGCAAPKETASKESAPSAAIPTVVASSSPPPSSSPSSVDAPVWHKGDAWSITSKGGGSTGESSFLVVTDASSDAYTLGTTSQQLAAYDAAYDVSYVGKIRASDLAGAQKDQPVQFFSFPLTDGKTWTAKWDGLDIALTAKATGNGFQIDGMSGSTAYVHYDYVPALKWWSHIDFEAGYGFKVDRRVENWTGNVQVATAKSVYSKTTQAPVASAFVDTFHVDDGQTLVLFQLAGGASAYVRAFKLIGPDNTPYSQAGGPDTEATGTARGVYDAETLPGTAGDWRIVSPIVHAPDGQFVVSATEVAIATRAVP